MSKPQPPFHDLRLPSDAPLWTEGPASARRAFLMPLANPYDFLAFGALGTPHEVCFVARGSVREHLGAFITRLVRDDAQVELWTRAPVAGWLLKQYTRDPGYEGHEYEEPPSQPVNGLGADRVDTAPGSPLWTQGDALTRRVFLLPVSDPTEFLAIGALHPPEQVLFKLVGSVRDQLGAFIEQMERESARVELHVRPPLPEPLLQPFLAARADEGRPT